MENNESKKDENSCNFYHQLHTENVNFTKNSLQFRSPYKLVACLKFPVRKNSDECRPFKLFSDKATDLQFIPTNMHMKQYNTVRNKGYEQYLIIFSD